METSAQKGVYAECESDYSQDCGRKMLWLARTLCAKEEDSMIRII